MDAQPVNAVVDRISIVQMQERYSLSTRQAVYDRLKKVGIQPIKGTIDVETELPLMDDLHNGLEPAKPVSSLSTRQNDLSSRQLDSQSIQPEILMALLQLATQSRPAEPSAIAQLNERLEFLEACEKRGNTLSTSELAPLLGLSSKALGEKHEHFQYGYVFQRCGKHSHELAWSIQHVKK